MTTTEQEPEYTTGAAVSVTNPDGFVNAQRDEMTATLRALWLLHRADEIRAGGSVGDPDAEFSSWLRAVSGGDPR